MDEWWARIEDWPANRWLLLVLILMVLVYGYSIFNSQSTVIQDGRRVFWLHDDMMISMRYGRNLAEGYGLVWNPGSPPVEGYSNLAWVLIMAVVHLLPLPDMMTSLVMLVINVFLAGMVLVFTTRLALRLVPRPGIWLLGALVTMVVGVDLARWTVIGLEAPLLTAVFLWLLIRVLDESQIRQPRFSTFFFAGMLGLIRVDGPLLALILCFVAFGLHQDRRRVLAYSLLALLLPVAHVLFRLAYYGHPLPNTYYLKLSAWNDRFLPGAGYLLNFLGSYQALLGVALLSAIFARDSRLWLLLVVGVPLLAYSFFVGGDDFGGARFFAPWLPVLFILAFSFPQRMGWENRPLLLIITVGFLALFTMLMTGYDFFQGPGEEATLSEGGLVLSEATWPDTEVGVFWAGTLPYFSHRQAVDMLGKNDAYIARLPANEGSLKPGHNKFDYDYSLGELQPDFVVSPLSLSVVAEPRSFEFYIEGDDAYAGQLFLNETFQQEYAPTLIMIDLLPVFVRSSSPERERLLPGSECEPVMNEELQKYGLETVCWLNGR